MDQHKENGYTVEEPNNAEQNGPVPQKKPAKVKGALIGKRKEREESEDEVENEEKGKKRVKKEENNKEEEK